MNFVIHWNEKALGSHVFPIPIPPPTYKLLAHGFFTFFYHCLVFFFFPKNFKSHLLDLFMVCFTLPLTMWGSVMQPEWISNQWTLRSEHFTGNTGSPTKQKKKKKNVSPGAHLRLADPACQLGTQGLMWSPQLIPLSSIANNLNEGPWELDGQDMTTQCVLQEAGSLW